MEDASDLLTTFLSLSLSLLPRYVYHYRLPFVIFKIDLLTQRAFSHTFVCTAIFIRLAGVISCVYTHGSILGVM